MASSVAVEQVPVLTEEGDPNRDRLLAMTLEELLTEAARLGVPPSQLMRSLD